MNSYKPKINLRNGNCPRWLTRIGGICAAVSLAFTSTVVNADSCNPDGAISASPAGPYVLPSDVITITLKVGAGAILQDTDPGNVIVNEMTIDQVSYALDCESTGNPADLFYIFCQDDGNQMEYQGDGTISTDCPGNWSSILPDPLDPNKIDFVPDAALVLQEQTSCNLSFDVVAQNPSDDLTPQAIEVAAQYGGFCTDLDPVLAAAAVPTASFTTGTCDIDLEKQVSVDGGTTWFDADAQGDPDVPDQVLGGGAKYRLIVENTGSLTHQSLTVSDPTLGFADIEVGPLASGAQKTVLEGDIAELNVIERCIQRGFLDNTASALGVCNDGLSNGSASAEDPAWLRCIGTPDIEVVKEVSIDGGTTYFDANDIGTAPTAVFPNDAHYRLTVRNIGTVPLENVLVNDATLGIVDAPVANLPVGGEEVLESGDLAALHFQDRCTSAGDFGNTASAQGDSVDTGETVNDSDPAWMKCVGTPDISILKEIWDPDALIWRDANEEADAPLAFFPSGALYRITVTNTGTSPLENVLVNDPILGIVDYFVGNMAIGQVVVLESGDIPALDAALRCESAGPHTNDASTSGESAETGQGVNDSDIAILVCRGQPDIMLKKEVSLDGITYFDANTEGEAPEGTWPHDAYYRMTVTNIGTTTLDNIVLNDATLGIVNEAVATLAPGEFAVLDSGDLGALFVVNRCESSGTFSNVAIASASAFGIPVQDDDPAFMKCVGDPSIQIVKEISIDAGLTWFDANTPATAPTGVVPSDALYRFTVTNTGTTDLFDVVVNDPTLGIVDYPVGTILQGAPAVVIEQGDLPALFVEGRCSMGGTVENIAAADGAYFGVLVHDDDPANLNCRTEDACLTRTPGFWGTHPHVTIQFLPLSVCGVDIDNTMAGNTHSSAEAMCVNNNDAKANGMKMPQAQLIRQLMAAKLNVAASIAGEGGCGDFLHADELVNINDLIESCELQCGESAGSINESECIEKLDTFNNSQDTLDPFGSFIKPGPASPEACQASNGNGIMAIGGEAASSGGGKGGKKGK